MIPNIVKVGVIYSPKITQDGIKATSTPGETDWCGFIRIKMKLKEIHADW